MNPCNRSHMAGDESEKKTDLIIVTTRVVEYLEPLMSKELLCKFPDNSSFDFDYSQSAIWSPLISRPFNTPINFDFDHFLSPRKRLSYDEYLGNLDHDQFMLEPICNNRSSKQASSSRSFTNVSFNLDLLKIQRKNKRKVSDLSPTVPSKMKGTCNPPPIIRKGWNKLMKAASKQFKKRRTKIDHPSAHARLSNSFRDGYI